MANASRNGGLIPRYDLSGQIMPTIETVVALASDSEGSIYVGDPVRLAAAGQAVTGKKAVTLCDAGETIYGVVVEVVPDVYDSLPYRADDTLRTLKIEVGREIYFEIEEDAVGGALTEANIGNVVDLINTGTGSARTGESACKLDSNTAAAGSSAQLLIVGFIQRPDNELSTTATTAYNKWLVAINERQLPLGDSVNGV